MADRKHERFIRLYQDIEGSTTALDIAKRNLKEASYIGRMTNMQSRSRIGSSRAFGRFGVGATVKPGQQWS